MSTRVTDRRLVVIDALTGIRALAAFFIVWFHFRQPLYALLPGAYVLDDWVRLGFLSVDVFFVLSGFIISYNYAEKLARPNREAVREYLWARVARIYPVHLLMTLVAAALVGYYALQGLTLNPGVDRTVAGLVGNLLMLQSLPGVTAWNGPSWTVSAEFAAYLLFPLVAWLLVRLGQRTAVALAAAVLVLQLVVIQLLSPYASLFPFNWVRLAGGFAVGCLAWVAWRHGGRLFRPGRHWDAVALGCVAVVAASPWLGSAWIVIPFLAVFVVAVVGATGPVRAFLAWGPMEYGGRVSYSVYLVHSPMIVAIYLLLPPQDFTEAPLATRIAVILAYVLGIVLVAVVVHHGVEEPARRWIRRRAARARRTPARTDRSVEALRG